jgi:hypothetical protein
VARIAVALASLWSIVIFSGALCRPVARSKKARAAA